MLVEEMVMGWATNSVEWVKEIVLWETNWVEWTVKINLWVTNWVEWMEKKLPVDNNWQNLYEIYERELQLKVRFYKKTPY
tara:strand:- start:129 stop:368 length:240 start_codon:yes stop_codon:yes gene_type:complete